MRSPSGQTIATLMACVAGLVGCVRLPAVPATGDAPPLWTELPGLAGIVVRFEESGRRTQSLPTHWDRADFTLYNGTYMAATRSQQVLRAAMAVSGSAATASTTIFATSRPGGGYWLWATIRDGQVPTALGRISQALTLSASPSATASISLATLPYWLAGTLANASNTRGTGAATGLARDNALDTPVGLAVRRDGVMFIAENGNKRIRRIDGIFSPSTAQISTAYDGLDLGTPVAMTYMDDGAGNVGLLVADSTAGKIHLLTSLDSAPTITASKSFGAVPPVALCYAATASPGATDSLFVADSGGIVTQWITPFGASSPSRVMVGSGSVSVSSVGGMAVNSDGSTLYVSDSVSPSVWAISLANGVGTRVAGNGVVGYSGDNMDAASASLKAPGALAYDPAGGGRLYIVDKGANVIRVVTLANGMITTLFGSGGGSATNDGSLTPLAGLDSPGALTYFDDLATPSLFVVDGHRIRSATP